MCEIIYNPNYGKYFLGKEHPFDPRRAEMTIDLLDELGVLKKPLVPEPVSPEDLARVHDKDYIDAVEKASCGKEITGLEKFGLGTTDNPIVKGMAEGARYHAGGTVLGARLLIEDKAKRVLQFGGGFHHARRSSAEGFCIYNDLALAIDELTSAGLHVVYLDIDVHHGDGVQEIFYSNDKVMTISIHESGEYLFPGTGWLHELGRGMGRSLKLNLPVEPFTEGESYLEVMEGVLDRAIKWYKPDVLIVQAGADAHFSDPLADLMLTVRDYERIFRRILDFTDRFCGGKVMFTLGGGYSLSAVFRIWTVLYYVLFNLDIPLFFPENWRMRWKEITGKELPGFLYDPDPAYEKISRKSEITRSNRELVRRLLDAVSPDWL